MATYIIGDVHGCYDELKMLLQKIDFNIKIDKLIFVGDIINKGPKSLETINFIMSLGNSAEVILGNHEILFLALSYNYQILNNQNSFNILFKAKNFKEIRNWLFNKKILIKINNFFITHAGIPHIWSPEESVNMANEVELVLREKIIHRKFLLKSFLKNKSYNKWNKNLKGIERYSCILNYFVNMRIIDKNGCLDIKSNLNLDKIPIGFDFWFNLKNNKFKKKYKIFFGHWASIKGKTSDSNIIALDTGCVYGGELTCYCIDTEKKYVIKALKNYKDI